MHQVNFFIRSRKIRDRTFNTRLDALAACEAWEERGPRHTCSIVSQSFL